MEIGDALKAGGPGSAGGAVGAKAGAEVVVADIIGGRTPSIGRLSFCMFVYYFHLGSTKSRAYYAVYTIFALHAKLLCLYHKHKIAGHQNAAPHRKRH